MSYAIAYSEGMEHRPAVPDFVVPLPPQMEVEGVSDEYVFTWTIPGGDKDKYYGGNLDGGFWIWRLYPPNKNNPSRTDGFCEADRWAAIFQAMGDEVPWLYCSDLRTKLATGVARTIDAERGLASSLHIYEAIDDWIAPPMKLEK